MSQPSKRCTTPGRSAPLSSVLSWSQWTRHLGSRGQPDTRGFPVLSKMAVQYGPAAPAPVLAGWQHKGRRHATDVPYWDAVAALNTPADLVDWEPGFDDQSNELSGSAITERRVGVLRAALDRLDDTEARHRGETTTIVRGCQARACCQRPMVWTMCSARSTSSAVPVAWWRAACSSSSRATQPPIPHKG